MKILILSLSDGNLDGARLRDGLHVRSPALRHQLRGRRRWMSANEAGNATFSLLAVCPILFLSDHSEFMVVKHSYRCHIPGHKIKGPRRARERLSGNFNRPLRESANERGSPPAKFSGSSCVPTPCGFDESSTNGKTRPSSSSGAGTDEPEMMGPQGLHPWTGWSRLRDRVDKAFSASTITVRTAEHRLWPP